MKYNINNNKFDLVEKNDIDLENFNISVIGHCINKGVIKIYDTSEDNN